jgi:hypothetical protein
MHSLKDKVSLWIIADKAKIYAMGKDLYSSIYFANYFAK